MLWTSVNRRISWKLKTAALFLLLFTIAPGTFAYAFFSPRVLNNVQQSFEQTSNEDSLTVSGTVLSAKDNTPLSGVSVVVKGTQTGTTTDEEGVYSLTLTEEDQTLVFTFVGYQKKVVPVKGRTSIDILLQEEVVEMNDIVVIGYGSQRRQDLTGSISSVSSSDIENQSITSVQEALQGQIAGVRVIRNSGAPGGGATVNIRGVNSIRAGNNPLYVIDGMPIGGGSSPSQNPLALVNPQDIASIEVLKDASATAIYGARGANGVVLITTKQGTSGDVHVDFEMKYGVQNIRNKLDLLNTEEYVSLANEAATNDELDPVFSQPADQYAETDWQDEIFRSAPKQDYQLSVSGGDDDTHYSLSANFLNEKGIIIGSGFKRGSFRINFNKQVSDRFSIGNNLILSKSHYNLVKTGGRGLSGIVNGALQIAPVVPVTDQHGNYVFQTENTIERFNPVAEALEKTNNSGRFKGVGNIFATYKLTDGLEARISLGADLNYRKTNFYVPKTTLEGIRKDSYGSVNSRQQFRWVNSNTLTYENEFLDRHKLKVMAGFTLERQTGESLKGAASGFITDAFKYNNLNAGSIPNNPSSGSGAHSLVSYLGRVNYSFDDRYLFTLTGRIDGSSRFGAGNRYGFFPSGAFAWRVDNEPFMQNQDVFSMLKLRLSYGITGNQEIDNFASLARLGNSQVTFGDRIAVGINPSSLGNENLQWEKTRQYNAGLDVGVFNGRIVLTADAYYKKTTDLLLLRRVPRYTGYSQYLDNVGSTENKGLELALDTRNLSTENFSWTSSLNFSVNRNNVLKLSDGEPLLVGTPISFAGDQNFRILQEGGSLGAFYGYKYEGVYRDQQEIENSAVAADGTQPGDPYLADLSGPKGKPDGKIDGNDRVVMGNAYPDFTFGFTNKFYYKGFDLSIFIQGSYGNDLLNMNTLRLESLRGYTNQTTDVLNRWTPENRDTNIPRAARQRTSAGQIAMRSISSRLIEDGSYIRLQNLALGYTLPVEWVESIGARNLRLYVSGQNLITLTNYSGYDPEVSTYGNLGNVGADYGTYPKARTFLIGLKLGF